MSEVVISVKEGDEQAFNFEAKDGNVSIFIHKGFREILKGIDKMLSSESVLSTLNTACQSLSGWASAKKMVDNVNPSAKVRVATIQMAIQKAVQENDLEVLDKLVSVADDKWPMLIREEDGSILTKEEYATKHPEMNKSEESQRLPGGTV